MTLGKSCFFGWILFCLLLSGCSESNAGDDILELRYATNDTLAICGDTVIFEVCANSTSELVKYQWYKADDSFAEGNAIPLANERTYMPDTEKSGITYYYCIITNAVTSVISKHIRLSVVEVISSTDALVSAQSNTLNISSYDRALGIGQGVKLEYKFEDDINGGGYIWYSCQDTLKSGAVLRQGGNASEYHTDVFSKIGVYYFYCIGIADMEIDDATGKISGYVCESPVFSVAYTGLPTLYIDTEVLSNEITKADYISANFELVADGLKNHFSTVNTTIMLKGRGNSSWYAPKKGYNIKFDTKTSVLGMPESKKWCLISNYCDRSLLHNKYVSVVCNTVFKKWNPSFEYVDVVLNGDYIGNYILGEKIRLEKNRIALSDISLENEKGAFILEIDDYLDGDFSFYTAQKVPIVLKDPDEVSDELKMRIRTIVQTAEDSLYNAGSGKHWSDYIDIDSAVDWYIVNVFAKSIDAPFGTSVYVVYNPNDCKLHFGPNWDYDKAFGAALRDYCSEGWDDWYVPNILEPYLQANWFSVLSSDEVFIQALKARWDEISLKLRDSIALDIENIAADIQVSANYNFMRWPILGIYMSFNPTTGHEYRTSWKDEVAYMQSWCENRFSWMDTAIAGL